MYLIDIDFLKYKEKLKLKKVDGKTYVFDLVRKKNIRLFPEELVRQLCILYLVDAKKYSLSLMQAEKNINYDNQTRRYDLLIYNKDGSPHLLLECKAPKVKLGQHVIDQISHYNLALKVPFLVVTNGKSSFCFSFNRSANQYEMIDDIPKFEIKSKL